MVTSEETVLAEIGFGEAKLNVEEGIIAVPLEVLLDVLKLKGNILFSCEVFVELIVPDRGLDVVVPNENAGAVTPLTFSFFLLSVLGVIFDSVLNPNWKGEAELLLTGPVDEAVVKVPKVKPVDVVTTLVNVVAIELTDVA